MSLRSITTTLEYTGILIAAEDAVEAANDQINRFETQLRNAIDQSISAMRYQAIVVASHTRELAVWRTYEMYLKKGELTEETMEEIVRLLQIVRTDNEAELVAILPPEVMDKIRAAQSASTEQDTAGPMTLCDAEAVSDKEAGKEPVIN